MNNKTTFFKEISRNQAKEYYENNKERSREQAKNKYRELSKEEKTYNKERIWKK